MGTRLRQRARGPALLLGSLLLLGFASFAQAQVAVSDGGTPSWSQAIGVPPGVAGMSPKLALLYAGGGVNGPLGHGWSVQGISAITRCGAIPATDGVRGSVGYLSSDKLCLDGQRLIQTDANGAVVAQTNDAQGLAAGAVREFRTEKDMYARVRAYGFANGDTSGASGPAYFKVWTKSGQIYEYGDGPSKDANTHALITATGKTLGIAWAVSRIADTLGNAIDFKYEQRDVAWGSGSSGPSAGHEWNLREVQYAGNKVVFNYDTGDTRPDKAEAYHAGLKNVSVRRLQSITTYVNSPNTGTLGSGASAVAVKTTQLGYGLGSVSGRSRLEKVQDCAGGPSSTSCLPPSTFIYADGPGESFQANAAFASSPLSTTPLLNTTGTLGTLVADFNGDGRSDLLLWSDTPSGNQLFLSNGDGTFAAASAFNIKDQNLFKSDGCYYSFIADFNADGIPDLFRYAATTKPAGGACSAPGVNKIYVGQGDGSFTAVTPNLGGATLNRSSRTYSTGNYNIPTYSYGENFYLLDVNGDGRTDLVKATSPAVTGYPGCAHSPCTFVYLGDGAGNFSPATLNAATAGAVLYSDPKPSTRNYFGASLVDVDGDGLLDILVDGAYESGGPGAIYRSRGDGNFDAIPLPASTRCKIAVDANGDGRQDCLNTDTRGTTPSQLLISTGVASTVQTASFNPSLAAAGALSGLTQGTIAFDVNGDGRDDLLRWNDTPTSNVLYRSNGDGSFTASSSFNLNTQDNRLRKVDGSADFTLGDFLGQGSVQILRMVASPTAGAGTSNQLYVRMPSPTTQSLPDDTLVQVTNPTGSTTKLNYLPLSNPKDANQQPRYQSDRGTPNAATYPQLDVTAPIYVVTQKIDDSGIGSNAAPTTTTTDYAYLGLKADQSGRGLLGYREIRRQSPAPDGSPITVATQYVQTYPYTGVAARSDTRLGALNATTAQLLSSTVNAYCDTTAAAGSDTTALNAAQAGQAGAICPTSAKIQRPYLLWSKETGTDLNGNPLPTVTTLNTYSPAGDPMQIAVTTTGQVAGANQTSTQVTTNQYLADNTAGDSWILARLSRATVQNTVPNLMASLATSAGSAANASAVQGTGQTQFATLSPIAFGNVALASTSTKTATLANTGASTVSLTVPSAASVTGAGFTFTSTTCAATLAAGASCTVGVRFSPSAATSYTGTLSVAVAGGQGTLTASLSGAGIGSLVSVSANNVQALNASVGGVAATGTVVFTNAGNQAASLTLSGLHAPYSVAPTTCSAPAGGNCTVTVTMATSGAIGAQGSQTLVATGSTAGPVSAAVSGTLTGSSIAVTANNAQSLSTTPGAAPASGTVVFTNSGNAAANLSFSGLSGPYSVAPTSCTAPAGGNCTVTVTMAATGAIGAQGTQTLTASGGAMGPVSTTVSGTVTGSQIAVTIDNAGNMNVPVGGSASGVVAFTNTGNRDANLTLSGLSAPYSVSPTSCVAPAGASCTVTVAMATNGPIGPQGNQTLTASGGTTGPVSAPVGGTLLGSAIAVTVDNAGNLSAPLGGGPASGVVIFSNSGNQDVALSLSGLSAPYSVSPTSCTAPAGGNCTVTVTMATGGPIGAQGAQTLTASGGTNGPVSTPIGGTVTGAVATLVSAAPNLGNVWQGAPAPSAGINLRNDGNVPMSLAGLGGLGGAFSLVGNNCTNIAPGNLCTMTVSMATGGAASGPLNVSTQGAAVNASFPVNGSVSTAVSQWATTSLAFGSVTYGTSSTQNVTVTNIGFGPLVASWSGPLDRLPAGFSSNTSACAQMPVGASCNVAITFSPTALINYGGGNITPPGISSAANSLSVSGTGGGPVNLTISSSSNTPYNIAGVLGSPGVPVAVTLTIAPGVVQGSSSTALPAIQTGTFSPGSTVTIINNGTIAGAGGNGSPKNTLTPGGAGGPGLILNMNANVINNGVIQGGGGGGGNSAAFPANVVAIPCDGGGGAGAVPGNGNSGSNAGASGTLSAGGIRSSTCGNSSSGSGGAPGMPGVGGSGYAPFTYYGTAGGAGGAAIVRNGFSAGAIGGTVKGAIQ